MCIIEAVSGDIPWDRMQPVAVRFQVKRGNLPLLSESMNEKQYNLIQLMTKKEPTEPVKMVSVVDKLSEIAQDEWAKNTVACWA